MSVYRSDIDGLRAVSVISVVLFHLGFSFVPGGFIGVDVFFVISGYLITGIILKEMTQERFSLLGFYERRARRILPALFAMIAVTTVAASVVMVPSTFEIFGSSVVAAALSVSNVFFWFMSGYFTVASASRPLLHTWSLGVEEQFYLLFPLWLMLLRRKTRLSPLAMILPLAAVSFAIAVYQVQEAPRAAFYLPFSRFWELMLGAALASGAVPRAERYWLRQLLSAVGLLLVLGSVLLLNEAVPFPGAAALAPCLGAGLVIHAGGERRTWVQQLLSLPPIVFVGLISYSLYLWHWPAIVLLQSFVLQRDLLTSEALALLVLTTAVSVLSWRYIEQPFRHRGRTETAAVLKVAGLSIASVAALGFAIWATHGLPTRFSDEVRRYAEGARDRDPMRPRCDAKSADAIRGDDVCRIGVAGKEPTFAVVGDSFAAAMVPGIGAAARQAGRTGIVLTRSGCNPLFDVDQSDPSCRMFMDAVADRLAQPGSIRTVILLGRWTRMAEGSRFGSIDMADAFITDDQSRGKSIAENHLVFARAMDRLPALLSGKSIYIAAFFPEQAVDVPQAAFFGALTGKVPDVGVPRAVFDQRQHYVRQVLTQASQRFGIHLIDVGAHLCDQIECHATKDGRSLYFDDNHLTMTTALNLSSMFDPAVKDAGPPAAMASEQTWLLPEDAAQP